MRRYFIWAFLILALALPGFALDTLRTANDSTATVVLDSTGKVISKIYKSTSVLARSQSFPTVSIGAGIPAVSVNIKTGAIGFLSSVDPLQISFNFWQYKLITNSQVTNFAFWVPELGLSLSKTEGGGFGVGASLVPWAIRINSVTLGLGLRWTATDSVTFAIRKRDWSIIVPVTYAVF
jgi:hypothetical protein